MEPHRTENKEFSVLHFSLETTPEGKPVQRVRNVGRFTGIEAAFNAARLQAWKAWKGVQEQAAGELQGVAGKVQVRDTEWGYDLRIDTLTVARFWVHDGQAADALAI